MEQRKRAVKEVLGYQLKPRCVNRFFYNVYRFLLYKDTGSLMKTLDYRSRLCADEKPEEHYLIFRYMLRLLKERHPNKLASLSPSCRD